MKNTILSIVAVFSTAGYAMAEEVAVANPVTLTGEIKTTIAETAADKYGATTTFGLDVGVTGIAFGGLDFATGADDKLALDEWHIGANLGSATVYLPGLEFMRNNKDKRHLICAGASAGVSVAFGAPIGGALFLYELSRGNPVWTFTLLWKTFFTCCVAVFSMGFLDNVLHGEKVDWSESALKFASS